MKIFRTYQPNTRKDCIACLSLHQSSASKSYFLLSLSLSLCKFSNTHLTYRELIEEIDNFENAGLPISRPNSMNNYGVILDEIGFTPFLADLRDKCVSPFAKLFFANDGGTSLDSHHGFVVSSHVCVCVL